MVVAENSGGEGSLEEKAAQPEHGEINWVVLLGNFKECGVGGLLSARL